MKIRITAFAAVLFALMFVSATAAEVQAQYESSPGYKVVYVPNPDMVEINVNRQLTTHGMEMTYDSSYMGHKDREEPSPLMKRFMAIKGVTDVYIKPYSLTIGKGSAFRWNEIMPKVMAVLKSQVAPKSPFKQLAPPEHQDYQPKAIRPSRGSIKRIS